MCCHDELDHELELTQARHETKSHEYNSWSIHEHKLDTAILFDTQQKDSTHHPSLWFFLHFPLCLLHLAAGSSKHHTTNSSSTYSQYRCNQRIT